MFPKELMGTAVCRPGSGLYNRILSLGRLSARRANAYAYRLDHTKIQTGQAHLQGPPAEFTVLNQMIWNNANLFTIIHQFVFDVSKPVGSIVGTKLLRIVDEVMLCETRIACVYS